MKSRQVDAEVDLTQFAEKDERCCGTNRNASDASKTATLSFITALIASNVLTPLHGVVGSNASTVHKLSFFSLATAHWFCRNLPCLLECCQLLPSP